MVLRNRVRLLAAVAASVLSACGGGGGGGGGSAIVQPPAPPTAVSTGLVPAPPAAGATLATDATVYRPLIPNATWTYHGTRTSTSSPSFPTVYLNVVTHQAAAAGVTESHSAPDDDSAETVTVTTVDGAVHQKTSVDLGNGKTLAIDDVELRSPVRANDQYTILDEVLADSGVDLDGDGKSDEVDLAVYAVVVGNETIDLPSNPHLQTVRVRTTALIRAKSSASGAFSPTVTSTQDNWYAAGIGLVKHTVDEPGSNENERIATVELLESWDGVTKGMGVIRTTPLAFQNGESQSYVAGVAAFKDHAVFATLNLGAGSGTVLTSVDAKGVQLGTVRDVDLANSSMLAMADVGGQLRIVTQEATGVAMHFYDAFGAKTRDPVILLPADGFGNAPFAASDGSTVWVMFEQLTALGTRGNLVAIPFDSEGKRLSDPVLLSDSLAAFNQLQAVGAHGSVLFTWSADRDLFYAIGGGGRPLSVHRIADAATFDVPYLVPIAHDDLQALLWFDGAHRPLEGVTFDSAGGPLRTTSGPIFSELLPVDSGDQPLARTGNVGTDLDLYTTVAGRLWAEETYDSTVATVSEIDASAGPLAQRTVTVIARGRFGTTSGPLAIVTFPGSVLLLTARSDFSGYDATAIWRRTQ